MEPLLPIRRRASQHPRRANRSPRGTRPSCKLTARPCAASQKAATTPLTNHKKNPQPRFNRNQQYSITAITDGSGGIAERYAYTAYGTPTITDASGTLRTTTEVGNRYTYTGREWDETLALYHYRARMYDSVSGRFCSRDPIGYMDGTNRYATYLSLSALDPSGHLRVEVNQKAIIQGCSACGNFDWQVDVSIGRVTDGSADRRGSVYFLVQRICTHRFLEYCDSECGACVRQNRGDDTYKCCHNEFVGAVTIAGNRARMVGNSPTIPDVWTFGNGGDGECHSIGYAATQSDLYLVPHTDELERIFRDPTRGFGVNKPCGEGFHVIQAPGPREIDVQNSVGHSSMTILGHWDCCPKKGRHCIAEESPRQDWW